MKILKILIIISIVLFCTSCYSTKNHNKYTVESSKHNAHYYNVKNKQHYYNSNTSFDQLTKK